ncbi:MAG: sn-glycerol-3-phosphate ABC transporter ATP-binding protein UgpC [Silvanigrellales bacterium]|jgi:ABC-type sugar transport system ATPase subunit|nr:sn-glycerol-3-phosphate ABC transporter ATP-binding protein UgpC [Silvanigrellales bacterium]
MSSLTLSSVCKTYANRVEVLRDVNLDVQDGEFIVLVGPSGCGKSTLLRMIAGLEDITSGDIKIGAKRVNALPPAERDISMVFQDYALYPHMSVRENLSFGLRIRKSPLPEIHERVSFAARMLSIEHLLDRLPSQLSGGQRQRVAIGRAIVRKPSLFLFDEPLSNLDAQLRSQTRIELASLHRELGTTVVYVTHDQVEAMTLATRIVVLEKGVIQQVGTPLELYDAPANRFVASFIGNPSMNFFEGDLVFEGGSLLFTTEGHTFNFTGAPRCPGKSGRYVLGLRPEAIKVLTKEGRESEGPVDASPVVVLVEPHGHESHLVSKVGARQVVIRSSNPKRLEVMERAKPGDALASTIDRNALHWFGANSAGARIV